MTVSIVLEAITKANRAQVEALELEPEQIDLVASNVESLEEADEDEDARPCAIIADGSIVGFLMYDTTSEPHEAQIYRFMIDRSHQGRGFGWAALRVLLEEISANKAIERITICYESENHGARKLYAKAGFVETGLDEDGEMIAVLDLCRNKQLQQHD